MLRAVGRARCTHRRATRQVLPWLIAVAVLAAGRLDAAAQTVAADAPTALTVTATDQAFQAPDTIPAGVITFRLVNDGEQVHMALLVRLEPGRSAEDFVEAYRARAETGAERPAWARYLGGPGVTPPQGESNATFHLEPGSYVMICGIPFPDGHLLKPHALEVRPPSGDTSAPSAPEPTVSLRLVDHSFQLSAPLTAGRHTFHVENAGVEPHEVILVKLAPGKTADDLRVWMRGPMDEAEPPITEVSGGLSALATGADAYFEADLSPGDYVLYCMITGPDGRAHIEYGMIQHIHIG